MKIVFVCLMACGLLNAAEDLAKLRDRQDRAGLDKAAAALHAEAEKSPKDAHRWYQAAMAYSYSAEVAYELRDKQASERAAVAGVADAEKAVAINNKVGDYYRVLGTLCGQVIPANPIMGALAYGKRAKEALDQALLMDPKSARVHVAHGVGFYYLPTNFGGGPDNAIKDYREAIALDPKSAEAYLWMGVAYAKQHQYPQAREAFSKSLQLDPDRLWTKQQLAKLPAK
ncbi:MAG: tetratricopeptide repeat protein [Terriglobia bacterium]